MKSKDPDAESGSLPVHASSSTLSLDEENEARQQEHFRTDHLVRNLKRRTISSGAVTVSSQAGKFFLTLVSTMIMARLLTPADFGLIALVTTVTGWMRVFKEAGLSAATVQRDKITHAQVSNLFWINVGVGAASALIVASLGPALAWFYNDSRLMGVALLLSGTFLISGSGVQHQALLRRQMRFKAIAMIDLGSYAIGVAIGIFMALQGWRYWSLVGSVLSIEASAFVLTWSISPWRPQWPTKKSGTYPLLSFGAARTAGDFILALARGSDNLLIGRVYGPTAVGLYSRAGALLVIPLRQFLGPINSVFIPALSRLQSQPERYRATFLRMYETIALVSFFFTALLLALSRPVTLVLLGPRFEQAALIFAGFTVASLCIPLANSAAWLFTTQGRGKDIMLAQATFSGAMVLSFIIGLPFGPVGVAIALSASNILVRVPVYYFAAGRRGPVKTRDLWKVFGRHLPVWIVVFVVTLLAQRSVAHFAPWIQLVICAPVGALAGSAFIFGFASQRRVAVNILETVRELKTKRRQTKYSAQGTID